MLDDPLVPYYQACESFLINTDIVNIIIGDMLWDPEDVSGETHANMLRPFQNFADATEELEEGEKVEIVIKNVVQFSLAISAGLTCDVERNNPSCRHWLLQGHNNC